MVRKNEKLLILNIDRDNDIGEKAGIKGPIIGRKDLLDAAVALGLSDPEDSDCNALFQTVKIADELKGKYETEAVALTGDRNVGIESDRNIQKQLDLVIKKFSPDFAVLVTDGSEDESVMPIIQSKVPILSVKTVIVKQSEDLESTYYKIKEFLHETMEDPKTARILFGLPAATLILYAIFDYNGWRLILGLLGAYFFIKGFKLEDYVMSGIDEIRDSFTRRRISLFIYIVSALIFLIASFRGYLAVESWASVGIFEAAAAFLSASVYIIWLGVSVAAIGKYLGHRPGKASGIVVIPMFSFAVAFVIHSAGSMILKLNFPFFDFILSVAAGFAIAILALVIERKWK